MIILQYNGPIFLKTLPQSQSYNILSSLKNNFTYVSGFIKPIKKYKCPQCHRLYSEKSTLTRHVNWECGKSPRFKCMWCPHQTKFKFSLMKHMKRHHLPLIEGAMLG